VAEARLVAVPQLVAVHSILTVHWISRVSSTLAALFLWLAARLVAVSRLVPRRPFTLYIAFALD
jgi:hypothetical protein